MSAAPTYKWLPIIDTESGDVRQRSTLHHALSTRRDLHGLGAGCWRYRDRSMAVGITIGDHGA